MFYISSIQTKILLGLLSVTVISISIVMFYMYGNSSEAIKRNAIQYASESLVHSDEKLRLLFRDIERVLTVISLDKEFISSSLTSNNEFPSIGWYHEIKRVESFLQSLRGYNSYIDRLGVVGLDSDKLFQSGVVQIRELPDDDWSKRLLNTEANRGRLFAEYRNGKVSVGKVIFNQGVIIGYCVLDINPEVLASSYSGQSNLDMQQVVVTSDGTIVLNHDMNAIGTSITTSKYKPFWSYENTSGMSTTLREIQYGTKEYILLRRYIPELEWTLITVISESDLIHDIVIVRIEMLRIIAVVVLVVIIASILIARQITRNLKSLTRTMESVKRGDFNARHEIITHDEAGRLGATFNIMMQRIRDLMQAVEERERQKREADFKALQAQIHPHFVYNTLNTIRYLAKIQHTPNIEELTTSFITLLRSLTNHQDEQISVNQEIQLLDHYMTIQQYRYAGKLQFECHVDPGCVSCGILKFTLQPLVENAILHGMGARENNGMIHVDVFQEGSDLICIVYDNGVGMTEEQIRKVSGIDLQREHKGRKAGVGLKNVNERIQLYYGPKYGITIHSEWGHSTTIEVKLPYVQLIKGDDGFGLDSSTR
ncbi:sensor histidine kinase [Paenibacillus sp. PL2-23]|uniref:sensor histidine kinase n=1 Tax=Paenibacillus sp. PL2-23 TaxID=2100729 RepID=UPI0030F53764